MAFVAAGQSFVSMAEYTRLSNCPIPEEGDVVIVVKGNLIIDKNLNLGRVRSLHIRAQRITGESKYSLIARIVRFTTEHPDDYLGCINANYFWRDARLAAATPPPPHWPAWMKERPWP
jgi:hypothetical protein